MKNRKSKYIQVKGRKRCPVRSLEVRDVNLIDKNKVPPMTATRRKNRK
jgi:hypothetical protein